MNFASLQKQLNLFHASKKDLLNFYFQSPKSQKDNALLRQKRSDLALLMTEQLLDLVQDFNKTLLICVDRGEISAQEIPNNFSFANLQMLTKMPEFYLIVGKTEFTGKSFTECQDNKFFFEIPSSGYLYGSVSPFMIEENQLRYHNKVG